MIESQKLKAFVEHLQFAKGKTFAGRFIDIDRAPNSSINSVRSMAEMLWQCITSMYYCLLSQQKLIDNTD